jgi:hypothetical protein
MDLAQLYCGNRRIPPAKRVKQQGKALGEQQFSLTELSPNMEGNIHTIGIVWPALQFTYAFALCRLTASKYSARELC